MNLGHNIKILLKTEWSVKWSFLRTSSDETKVRNTEARLEAEEMPGMGNRAGIEAGTTHSTNPGSLPIIKRNTEMFRCLISPAFSPVRGGGRGLTNSKLHEKNIYSLIDETQPFWKAIGSSTPHTNLERDWSQAYPKAQYILQQLRWELSR